MREGLAIGDLAAEGEEGRPHRIFQPAIRDDHVEDRLRVVGDVLPHSDGLKQPPRRRGNGGGARVVRPSARKGGVGNRHGKALAQRLTQGDAEREAGKTAASDQYADLLP
jgi:hypothetical protein